MLTYIHIYIYTYYTYIDIDIYIYKYIYICVCVPMDMFVVIYDIWSGRMQNVKDYSTSQPSGAFPGLGLDRLPKIAIKYAPAGALVVPST